MWPAFVANDALSTTLLLQEAAAGPSGAPLPTLLPNDYENSACEPVWAPLLIKA